MSTYLHDLDHERLPNHVGIVMDGNGRWARLRGLPRTDGHTAGEEAMWDTVVGANELGLGWLTMFAFSSENWKRPKAEVAFLMGFNRGLLRRRRDELHRMNVRVRFLGRRDWKVPRSVLKEMKISEELTRHNTGMTLTITFNYGGRVEVVDAVKRLIADHDAGRLKGREAHDRVDLAAAVPRRHAGSRSDHPDQRRGADQQLPSLAGCVQRALLHAGVLAGLRSGAAVRGDPRLPEAVATVRGHRRERLGLDRCGFRTRRVGVLESDSLAHVTTIDPDGRPQTTLAWVGLRATRSASATLPDQRKLRNLRRDPRITISIQTERVTAYGLHEYLVIYGTARVTDGGGPEVLQRLAHTYLGPDVTFPPMPDPPPGFVTRVTVDRLGGVGPWNEPTG